MRSRLILYSILAVVAILGSALVAGYFMPRQWRIEVGTTILAPPAAIHPLIATPRRFPEWIPWNKTKSPDIVYTYSGPEAGVGSVLAWSSAALGQGTLTLTKSDPTKGTAYDLVFAGYAELPVHGEIGLAEENGSTRVTLAEGGDLGVNPIARLFRGVTEGNLIQEQNRALERLKALAEGRPPPVEAPPR